MSSVEFYRIYGIVGRLFLVIFKTTKNSFLQFCTFCRIQFGIYSLIYVCFKVYFLIDHHCKTRLSVMTVRNEVAKVMFLHLSVILFTGGVCLSACWDTTPPGPGTPDPQEQTPPGTRHPLRAGTPREQAHPLAAGTPPPPAPPGQAPPPGADLHGDGYCCLRCASYRNALLFYLLISQHNSMSDLLCTGTMCMNITKIFRSSA